MHKATNELTLQFFTQNAALMVIEAMLFGNIFLLWDPPFMTGDGSKMDLHIYVVLSTSFSSTLQKRRWLSNHKVHHHFLSVIYEYCCSKIYEIRLGFEKDSRWSGRPLNPAPPLIFGKLCCNFFYDRYGCIDARRYDGRI